ncbi:hypothetical protein GCM10011386_38220 [Parapedobacter defluvii]|uniref:Uncharacterized protein n=1 Tax=Parapedobacter defluvii TaxID=2045106 RepID=A0ABQ1MKQ8_9SPHI|nr:hypothetical protein [Parapedobacter defluvii]GGC42378.1 hypothetical protein GCM10011386_38220 [Parapedobacter defluvii]
MIPDFTHGSGLIWPVLPPGIWDASILDIERRFAINERRIYLFDGLKAALQNLFEAGSPQVFLDGSYVTEKPLPNDYELCWDTDNVDPNILDPVFLTFEHGRKEQKEKYFGEFFPTLMIEGNSGKPFLDFFQIDKISGMRKGIVRLQNYLK